MADTKKPRVFLSYSQRDAAFVRHLAGALRAEGVDVWYDEGELRVGDTILRQIEEALEQSRYFLLVISPEYLSSQWSQFEMGVALGRDPLSPGRRILPVIVREVEPSKLPPWIAHLTALHAKDMPVERIASTVAAVVQQDQENLEAVRC